MKKVAIVLLVILGIGLLLAAIGGIVFAVNKNKYAGQEEYEERTYVEESIISSLKLDIASDDIELYPATDDKVTVVYYYSERNQYEFAASNHNMVVRQSIKNSWLFNLNGYNRPATRVYIPESVTSTLDLHIASGQIVSHCERLVVNTLEAKVTSGEMDLGNISALIANLNVTSGAIKVNNINTDQLGVSVSSGGVSVIKADVNDINVHIGSGDLKINTFSINGNAKIKVSTGSIKLNVDDEIKYYTVKGKFSTGEFIIKHKGAVVLDGVALNGRDIAYGSGDKKMDIEVSTGSVIIDFLQ